MEISKEVFGQLADSQQFLNHLRRFVQLSDNTLQKFFDAYISSPYRLYYCHHSDELSKIIELEEGVAHDLFHVFDLLVYRILLTNEPIKVIEALEEIAFENTNYNAVKKIFEMLNVDETKQKLREIDLIDDQIGVVNAHMPQINYHIDQRIVFDKGKIIAKLPIVLFQFREKHEDKNFVFELTAQDIDSLVNRLGSIKDELKNVDTYSEKVP